MPVTAKYYKFSDYFRKNGWGEKVYKITLDAGFSCPNIDGKISDKGCVYCDNRAFSPAYRKKAGSLEKQIEQGMKALSQRYGATKFIAYFQAFTNTYGPVERLKNTYDIVKKYKDIIGLSIGTRPDCIDKKVLELIGTYAGNYDVWIEYGMQSSNNKTLSLVNRGHNYEKFIDAVKATRENGKIKICAHVILGLPGETEKEMIETAKETGRLKLEGIKIHHLHVVKGTILEKWYNENKYKPMSMQEYIKNAAEFLEHLWSDTVIQRITADCPKELLVAPLWLNSKSELLSKLEKHMIDNKMYQGRLYEETKQ